MRLIIFSMFTLSASAANHYVLQSASGSANGSDWTNACTGFTGSCAISSLTRGDTYYVGDGSYGSQTFDKSTSGTSVITIKKATIADHGTSTGWSDAFGDGQAQFGSRLTFITSYWVVDGQTRNTLTTGHGFFTDNTGTATELCQLGQFGTPISNITVRYLDMRGHGYGQASVFDRGVYSNSPGTSNITFQYCYIHDMYVPILTRELDTMLFEYNIIANNNSRPESHAEPWSDSGTDNVIFRYNYIWNPEGTAVFAVLNGSGSSPTAGNTSANWQIYGNILYYLNYTPASGNNPGTAGIVYCANDASNKNWCDAWLIYNNTFYDFSYGTSSGRLFFENITGVTAPVAQNNMWDSCADGATNNNITPSYSYYRNTSHSPTETNTQTGTTSLFVDPSTSNFHLSGHTTTGNTLSSPYNLDLDGVTRGGDGTWDRGAFQLAGSSALGSVLGGKTTIGGSAIVR